METIKNTRGYTMKKPSILLIACLSLLFMPIVASAEQLLCKTDFKQIEVDVIKMSESTQNGETETIIKYSYPPLIKLSGGEEKFTQLITQAFELMKKNDISLTITAINEPTNNILLTNEEVCVFPVKSEMKSSQGNVKIESYMVAIRNFDDNTWKYVNGVDSSQQFMFTLLIPELPKNFQFPKHEIVNE